MIEVLLECHLLIVFIIIFRKLFHAFFSAKGIYGIWLLIVIRMIPFEFFIGAGKQTAALNLLSMLWGCIVKENFVHTDFRIIRMPWYVALVWIIGSVITFLWEYRVNRQFEKYLFENRSRLAKDT